jgi:hypothetical protein
MSGLVVALPATGVIATALAGVNRGWTKAVLIAAITVTTAGATLVTLYKDRQLAKAREQAIAALANLDTAVTGAGQPLVAVLGRVMLETSPAKLDSDVDTLRLIAITGATMHCGKNDPECRLRSAYYRLHQDRLDRVGDPVGRPTGRPPRKSFEPTDGRVSRRVIEIAGGSRVVRTDDVDAAGPGEFEDYPGREYRCVIAAPVRAGDQSFGLLIVDSDRPRSLSGADAEYVNLVAGILAAGYAHHRAILHAGRPAASNSVSKNGTVCPSAPRPRAGQSTEVDDQAAAMKGDDDVQPQN